ncbi:hypothetical protein QKC54_gp0942 [Megavirus baoshan]|uniref:Uncharacterized protein n=1 Tax=Megavirus baoshan TaxID=2496520 RepID=A0A8K1T121_9VIRU|nr:hypothetical protein QKC54_gp0942 [Megavirus baoshan]UFX99740.1 hypothetical protein Mb0130 [Megavirus baoshan]
MISNSTQIRARRYYCDIAEMMIPIIGLIGGIIGFMIAKIYISYQKIFNKKINKNDRASYYIFGLIVGTSGIYVIIFILIIICAIVYS